MHGNRVVAVASADIGKAAERESIRNVALGRRGSAGQLRLQIREVSQVIANAERVVSAAEIDIEIANAVGGEFRTHDLAIDGRVRIGPDDRKLLRYRYCPPE